MMLFVNTFRVRPKSSAMKNGGMTFAERLKEARQAAGLTQEQLAHACGYTGQSRIANYEATGPNARSPSLAEIPTIASALGVPVSYLLGDELQGPSDIGWAEIRGVNQHASLGPGAIADEYAETHKLKFRAESLRRKKLHAENLAVLYGKGDSMSPTIDDGDAILFDQSDTTPRDNGLYVISYDGHIMAKRLIKLGGMWFIESDNKSEQQWKRPVAVDETKDFVIHGRVKWLAGWVD